MLKVLPILLCDYLFFRRLIYVIFVRDCSCFEFYTLRESDHFRSFSGPYFLVFSVSLRIQSKCGKIRIKNSRIRTLHAVTVTKWQILERELKFWLFPVKYSSARKKPFRAVSRALKRFRWSALQ